jgi:uncharacterized Zn finger protein
MAITKKWLKENTNSKSYSRGEGYYDEVEDLTKIGNAYSATVFGTEEYEITITDFPSNPVVYCDCPYDLDGFCKHIVAVCLNIIDGNFEEEAENTLVLNKDEILGALEVEKLDTISEAFKQLPIQTFYDDYFLKQDVLTRMNFLRQLFAQNESIRQQFYAFSKKE